MRAAPEVTAAAQRILDGDDSAGAAAALEASLHAHHPYDEQFEDLLETVALYAPLIGNPYTDYRQLCNAIRAADVFDSVGGSP